MRVVLNGDQRELTGGATLADLATLAGVAAADPGVAAAVDGEVVPRAAWSRTLLREGTRVELVRAAAGG